MTFKTLYAVVVLSFAFGMNPVMIQSVQASAGAAAVPSLLEGDDAEAKIASALTRLQALPAGYFGELEDAVARLTDQKGKLVGDQFTSLLELVVPGVLAVNGAVEACSMMQNAFCLNKELKNPALIPFDTHRIAGGKHAPDGSHIFKGEDLGEGMVDFHSGLGAPTLLHKVTKLQRCLSFFQDGEGDAQGQIHYSLQSAFEAHCRLLTEKYEGEVVKLQATVTKTSRSFEAIHALYPEGRGIAPDALAGDLDALKMGVAGYRAAVKAYGDALTVAKKWQASFEKLTVTHQTLGETLAGIVIVFADLRRANGDNPHLPRDEGQLTDISAMGALGDLQEALSADQATVRSLQTQLAAAKKWAPAAAADD